MNNQLEMEGIEPNDQAKEAIIHTLKQIRNKPEVGYYLGELTETFSLLTEAAATLFGEPVEKVREYYRPQNPKKPCAS